MVPTIKDISRDANVSIATVSKVLNGDYSKASEDTKNRVLAVAKKLNYRPNLLARSLVSRKSHMLGLVVPDIANPYYADMCRGMADEAKRHGYATMISNTDRQAASEKASIQTMLEYSVAGVVQEGIFRKVPEHIDTLPRPRMPYVLVDYYEEGMQNCVYTDDYTGSFHAVTHLIKRGHKHIGYISGFPEPEHPKDHRLRGYRYAIEQAVLTYDPYLV